MESGKFGSILSFEMMYHVCTKVSLFILTQLCMCALREEWGNPNEEKFFDYMMGYSPINNVKKGAKYPSCLLTGGLHDPRGK